MNHKREKQLEAERRYREKHRKEINERCKLRMRKLWKDNPELARSRQNEYRWNIRTKAIKEYGGICVCCGEKEMRFLTFDHINGGGLKERKASGKSGVDFIYKLTRDAVIRNKKREDIQILCYNCNMSKGFYGKCPHKN